MNLEDAKKFLDLCQRNELRNHKRGTRRISWFFNRFQVAEGSFSLFSRWVTIYESRPFNESNKILAMFIDEDAAKLQFHGDPVVILRSDEGEPMEYQGA